MGRGWNRGTRMNILSWAIFRSQTHFFRNFFEVNFIYEFGMDFYRFWKSFGMVLGVQNPRKIEIFHIFGDVALKTLIKRVFCLILREIYIEKHIVPLLFFWYFLLLFLMLEPLKIVLPCRRELIFYKIDFLAPHEKRDEK